MSNRFELTLVDLDFDLVHAWREAFAEWPGVRIEVGDILKIADDTLVSPANSCGYMDGGVDRHYVTYFGQAIQRSVQDAIKRRAEGRLPVGASLLISAENDRIPYLIVAPTMETPGVVPASNAYRAFRAVLRLAQSENRVKRVYCPGLATGVGQVDHRDAANEMALAYRDWLESIREPCT